jgi:hypothetical protein
VRNIMHVPVAVPWFGDLLEMAANKGMDVALLGQLLAQCEADDSLPAADKVCAVLGCFGSSTDSAVREVVWRVLGILGLSDDPTLQGWQPDAQLQSLQGAFAALSRKCAELEARLAPGSPAAGISAAAAAAAVTPMPASPGLCKGPGYEARDGGTAHFPCEIMDKQTAVVSYTVRFDNNGETKNVEPAAVRAVTRTRARTATKRPAGCVDPLDPRFDKDAAEAAGSSPDKKRRRAAKGSRE